MYEDFNGMKEAVGKIAGQIAKRGVPKA